MTPRAGKEAAWLSQFRAEVKRRIRARKGTQAALADHLGISPKHMSDILRGVTSPSPELAERIAAAAGLRITVIEEGDPVPLGLDMRGRKAGSVTTLRALREREGPAFLVPPEGGTFPVGQFGRITVDGKPVKGTITFTPIDNPEAP
jgi:transcriptional regulator with XRE-family HTH domain